jgi:hypothetical protein
MNAFDVPRSTRRPVAILAPVAPVAARAPREIALRYPASWFTMVNPAAATIERRTSAWLREMGVLTSVEARSCFESLAVGAYGGWPFPFADVEHLETITRFLTLWIYYDDVIEGAGEGRETQLAAALCGEPNAKLGESPCLRGFWEVARRYRAVMSGGWLARHAGRYLEWVRSVRSEAPIALRYQASRRLPSVEEYLELRRMTIGILPTLTFIEYVTERELPDEVRHNPAFQAIERIAAELVAIPNDLFGYSKDRLSSWVNAVSCAAAEKGGSIPDAMALCAERHNRRVVELRRLEKTLLAQVADRALVEEWLRKLHHVIHGFARWHDVAPRYSRTHTLDDGSQVALVVRYT